MWCVNFSCFTLAVISFIIWWEISFVKGVGDTSLRILVPSGTEQCFYQHFSANEDVWIDYSVVGATRTGVDINFQLSDPDQRPLVSEFKKSFSNSFVVIKLPGVYKICFDNTHSRFNTKTVAFQMTSKNSSATNWERYNKKDLLPEGVYDVKVNDIKTLVNRVRVQLNQIQTLQDTFREAEYRDRIIAESNFERVNYWSAVFVFVTLLVLSLQTFTVRMFFEPKDYVQRKLQNLTRSRRLQ